MALHGFASNKTANTIKTSLGTFREHVLDMFRPCLVYVGLMIEQCTGQVWTMFCEACLLFWRMQLQTGVWCPANLSDVPWWNLKPGAEWMSMLHTALTRLDGLCALFLIPGVTLMTVSPDHMHAKNQGVDAYFLGSIVWFWCM